MHCHRTPWVVQRRERVVKLREQAAVVLMFNALFDVQKGSPEDGIEGSLQDVSRSACRAVGQITET